VTKEIVDETRDAINHQLAAIKQLIWHAFNPTATSATALVPSVSATTSSRATADGIGSDMASVICQYLHVPLTIEQHRRAVMDRITIIVA
jgi:hypothetical protein